MRKKSGPKVTLQMVLHSHELRKRTLITIGLLALFVIGAHVPIPGISANFMDNHPLLTANVLSMYDLFAGGSLKSLSVFALGIGPYISASIVMQLLLGTLPQWKELKEEGQFGQRKIKRMTRWLTLGLAIAESTYLATAIVSADSTGMLLPAPLFMAFVITIWSSASMLAMWLGELITEHGIGSGSSLVICTGIAFRMPAMIHETWLAVEAKSTPLWGLFLMLAAFAVVIAIAAALQQSVKKLVVVGGKRPQSGTLPISETELYLPFNPSGVMPIVFATQCIVYLSIAISWFSSKLPRCHQMLLSNAIVGPFWHSFTGNEFVQGIAHRVGNIADSLVRYDHWEHNVLYGALIMLFALFYAAIALPPQQIAESLRRDNRSIPGIKPGAPTIAFLKTTLRKLTLVSASALAFIAIFPTQIAQVAQTPTLMGLGSTSLVILTGVALETKRAITSYAVTSSYHKRLLFRSSESTNEKKENS